jgi:hypothetical protein
LADWVQHRSESWKPKPVKRVYVRKADGRRRPLGIPVIADRCLQALAVGALVHDAIESICLTGKGPNPKRPWILDADLAAAFDRIDHDHLLRQLGTFPARGLVEHRLGRPRRRLVAPQCLDQPVGRNDLAGVQHQDGEHGALLVPAKETVRPSCHTSRSPRTRNSILFTFAAPTRPYPHAR